MLNNIRNFSKTFLAKILLIIVIIPFIFWGMGGVFNSGNTNNVAQINDFNISTQDFIDHLNGSNYDQNLIKQNIDNNVLEELLSNLISVKLIDLEIKNLNISISDKALKDKITSNKNFTDNGKFSRTKYEKFLLTNNLSALQFESNVKKNELQKKLFSFIGGGIKSPIFFTNKYYKEKTAQLEIEYIDLVDNYKKDTDFTTQEIKIFSEENKDKLKEEFIDFSYVKISPKDLTGSEEFNNLFFEKIDDIENQISNGIDYDQLIRNFSLASNIKKMFIANEESLNFEKKIYENRNKNKTQLIEDNEFFILYKIKKIHQIIPSLTNEKFIKKIRKVLFEKNKFEFNKQLLNRINEKKFNQTEFIELGNGNIIKTKINSIQDDEVFTKDSLKILYSLQMKAYTLVADKLNNIYLVKTIKLLSKNLPKQSSEFNEYVNQSNILLKNTMYSSYDYFLNKKYKITINQKTLERVKNYFR